MPDVPDRVRIRWSRGYGPATVVIAIVASVAVYHRLPAEVVTHWDSDGVPNGWSSRPVGAFGLPGLMLGVWAVLRAVPVLDPRRENYAKFSSARDVIANATLTLMLALHGAALGAALGYAVPIARLVPAGVGALLVAIGNVLPRVRPNFFIGVRTPWTLSSDDAWTRTHRLAGHLFAAAGVVTLLGALLLPPGMVGTLLLGAVATAAIVPTIFSYVVWARAPKRDR